MATEIKSDAQERVDAVVDDVLFDLTVFDELSKRQDDGLDVEIVDPTGKKIGITIRVSGPDSALQKRAIEKLRNERLESEDPKPLNAEELDTQRVRGLALSIISWTPFKLDGAEVKLSEATAMKLMKRFPFIREQVELRASNRAAFMPPSK